jgi:hypothetical protein
MILLINNKFKFYVRKLHSINREFLIKIIKKIISIIIKLEIIKVHMSLNKKLYMILKIKIKDLNHYLQIKESDIQMKAKTLKHKALSSYKKD